MSYNVCVTSIVEHITSIFENYFSLHAFRVDAKYNLLAKSCSSYFNLPIIASEHTQLSETSYFTRFLVESQILPEADFAGENKNYLKRILEAKPISHGCFYSVSFGGAYLLGTTLDSNLKVIYQLLDIEAETVELSSSRQLDESLANAIKKINPIYDAWLEGSKAMDEEILSLHVSRLSRQLRWRIKSSLTQYKKS